MVRGRIAFTLAAVFAVGLVASPVAAAKPGNSPNAKLCQKSGYLNLYDANGLPFSSVDACVSYAAAGGVFGTQALADLSISYNGTDHTIDVHNAGPRATSATMRVVVYEFANMVGPVLSSAPDGWVCAVSTVTMEFAQVFDCSTTSIAAGATAPFVERETRAQFWYYEIVASSVVDPDSTPDNQVTTEDDYLLLLPTL